MERAATMPCQAAGGGDRRGRGAVTGSTGVLPDADPQNMHVRRLERIDQRQLCRTEADLLIVIGSRAVCQADCRGSAIKMRSCDPHQRRSCRRASSQQTLALLGHISAVANRLAKKSEAATAPERKRMAECCERRNPNGPPTSEAVRMWLPLRDDCGRTSPARSRLR